ncbi:hypothetical protein [Polaribacter porphyrae]|uniref:Uncharacterized protein n=1 Tax=Polaribacter porphyrae TaxID=1137780 RepID=A0A2S7WLQ7_9FLAO|nr:hypothetical protein [Polaribacter porphyrae]PQJ78396.1 hypothetical protein BTO18_03950 [Polaribacter porphyrae]
MKKIIFVISLILVLTTYLSCKKKETKIDFKNFEISLSKNEEPPLIFELKCEDETQYFVENQPKKWDRLAKNSETTISVYEWKLFPHNNILFEYPRTYSFEAELSITEDIWTLSGNNFVIMVIRPIIEMDVHSYVNDLIVQFGSENCITKDITKKLNNIELKGIKLSVVIAGIDMELDILQVIDSKGKKSLIVFQDSLTDTKEKSIESKNTLERINQTFKIN